MISSASGIFSHSYSVVSEVFSTFLLRPSPPQARRVSKHYGAVHVDVAQIVRGMKEVGPTPATPQRDCRRAQFLLEVAFLCHFVAKARGGLV